ncbi:MAG: hypothetical protein MZV70_49515 [Desulfobacterales bacterium]|nr:hypothetical protein [Desulfobacterales bacterium]
MAKFNSECFDTRALTSKSLYEKMFSPHVKDWQYYGYGWWIDTIDMNGTKKTLISHGGSTDGYKAYSTRIVEDRTDIIILENDYFRTDVGVKWCVRHHRRHHRHPGREGGPGTEKSIAKAVGLTIGQAGIDKALAQMSDLKKNDEYQMSAMDYFYLASELDKKHGLKQESIKISQ